MANIKPLQGPMTLREMYPVVNENLTNINADGQANKTDITQHKTSKQAHAADAITYAGEVPGATVKEAIEGTNRRISEIVAQAGDSNTEIVDARGGAPVLGDRLNGLDAQLADTENKTESFIGASAFIDIQTAINTAINTKTKLKIPKGEYVFTEGIIIDGRLDLEGSLNDVIFDFSAMDSGVAITIGKDNGINGLTLTGARIVGNPNLTAIKMNDSRDINKPITDSALRDLRVQNFGVGLDTGYVWCDLFDNVRFQNCAKPLQLGSQTNNLEFRRVSLVSSTIPSSFTNSEGINFTSPNIANVTGNAFTLFQSNVSIINPYYEYISNYLAVVGATAEVIPSSFTSIGGKSTDPTVRIALKGNRSTLMLKNLNNSSRFVIEDDVTTTPLKYSHRIELDDITNNEDDFLVKWDGTTPAPFSNSYGGVTLQKVITRDKYTKVTATAGDAPGFQLGNLTIDEHYVLVYSLRKDPASTVNLRLGNLTATDLVVPNNNEAFEVRYLPFKAKSNTLRLLWTLNTTVDFSFIGIVKGCKFPKIPMNKGGLYATSHPTSGLWKVGDRVYNSQTSASGFEGWVCVTEGSPGTWKGFGAIEA